MVLSAAVLKESVRVKRSGSRREVSGDFCPSISFSVSEPEKEEGEEKGTDGNREKGNERGFSIEMTKKQRNYTLGWCMMAKINKDKCIHLPSWSAFLEARFIQQEKKFKDIM